MSEKLNNTIVGEELAEYVQNQITTRQKIHGSGVDSLRTPEQLNYLNSKTAWVKLASGTYLQPEKLYNLGFSYEAVKKFVGIGLAQNHILFGGYASLSSTGQLEALDTGSYQKTINEIQQNNPEQFKISGAGTFDVNQRTEFLGNNIKGAYLTGEDFGIVPMPGIESLDVKALNRGSLKKAIVKIKAQDRNQLAILDVLYLRLGYTVLLEWGNSVYLDNQSNLQQLTDTILENDQLFFNRDWNQDKAYDDILQYIENYRETYAGNYDGLLGKVSNFNWSFNKDGSYDVELTILSYGDIIESLKTNVTAPKDTYDLVLNQFTSDLRGKIVEDHRTDNIIFTYLKTFQIVSGTSKGVGDNVRIDGEKYGFFVKQGDAKIDNSFLAIIFSRSYFLYQLIEGVGPKLLTDNDFNYYTVYKSDGQSISPDFPEKKELSPTQKVIKEILTKDVEKWYPFQYYYSNVLKNSKSSHNGLYGEVKSEYEGYIIGEINAFPSYYNTVLNKNITLRDYNITWPNIVVGNTKIDYQNTRDVVCYPSPAYHIKGDNPIIGQPQKFTDGWTKTSDFPNGNSTQALLFKRLYDTDNTNNANTHAYRLSHIFNPKSISLYTYTYSSDYYLYTGITGDTNAAGIINSLTTEYPFNTPIGNKGLKNNPPYSRDKYRANLYAFNDPTQGFVVQYPTEIYKTKAAPNELFFCYSAERYKNLGEPIAVSNGVNKSKVELFSSELFSYERKDLEWESDVANSVFEGDTITPPFMYEHPNVVYGIKSTKDPKKFYWGLETNWNETGSRKNKFTISNLNNLNSSNSPESNGNTDFGKIPASGNGISLSYPNNVDSSSPLIKELEVLWNNFNQDNKSASDIFPAPTYNDKGIQQDKNYEFFHRFVAGSKEEAESNNKEFYVETKTNRYAKRVGPKAEAANPLKSINPYDDKGFFVLETTPKNFYIRFGFLLQILEDKVILKIDKNKPEDKYNENPPIVKLAYNTGSFHMTCLPNQISFDLTKCAVRRDNIQKTWDKNLKTSTIFSELAPWANEDTDEAKQNPDYHKNIADIMNIYLNTEFVGQCILSSTDDKGNMSAYEFINNICVGINKSLGGVNNLEPVIDETTNTLYIIDSTPKYAWDKLKGKNKRGKYELLIYGYQKYNEDDINSTVESTFVRKVDLKTAITPEYASMIAIGATAAGFARGIEATSFAKWNKGIEDRFKKNFIPGDVTFASSGSYEEDVIQAYQNMMQNTLDGLGITK